MQVAHEVDDRVGGSVVLAVGGEGVPGTRGGAVGQAADAGCVDHGGGAQRLRGPGDLQVGDGVGVQTVQVDVQRTVVAVEAKLPGGTTVGRVGEDLVGVPVVVPGDDAGALAGVGGGQPVADQRVEERGLAGLDASGDGDAQRLIQPGGQLVQVGGLRCATVEVAGLGQQGPGPVEQVHGATTAREPVTASARRRSSRTRASSASRSLSRLVRSAWVRLAASVAARRASVWLRLSSSARAV